MKDDSVYLRQIMDAVNRVQEYTGGLDFEAFTRNHAVRDAVILQVALIGEAANHVSERFSKPIPKSRGRTLLACATCSFTITSALMMRRFGRPLNMTCLC